MLKIFYGGRFQPPHTGHYSIVRGLESCLYTMLDYKPQIRVVTSDKTGPTSPFNFEDKLFIWNRMFGVVPEYSSNPAFGPAEYYTDDDVVVLLVGEKDIDRYRTSPKYEIAQSDFFEKGTVHKTAGTKIYVIKCVMSPLANINNGTYIRNTVKYNKEKFIELYGKFDEEVFELFNERLS